MPACVVKWCKSNTKIKCPGITFHYFPVDPIRKNKWIEAVKLERRECDWMPVKTSRVCSVHFSEKDFYKSLKGYTMLHKTAVPVCTRTRLEETSTSLRDTTDNEKINNNERLQLVHQDNSTSSTYPHLKQMCFPPLTVGQVNSNIIPSNAQIQSNNQMHYIIINDNVPRGEQTNTIKEDTNDPVIKQAVWLPEPSTSQFNNEVDIPESSNRRQMQSGSPLNPFDIFGKYVGEQLKILSEEEALLAQAEIKNVLDRYKRKHMQVSDDTLPELQTSESELLIIKYEPESDDEEQTNT